MKSLLRVLLLLLALVAACGDTTSQPDSGVILCSGNDQCPTGMYCNDGICQNYQDGGSGCRSDDDCPAGRRCELLTGKCVSGPADGGQDGGDAGEDGADVGGDESPECEDGEFRECGPGTKVGECDIGVEYCQDGRWSGVCEGAVWPEDEKCDGLDNDCDGELPADEIDADGDGFWPCQGDCDDSNAAVNPDASEIYCNSIDDDCDPMTPDDVDVDGDGFSVCGGDCDDGNAQVRPGVAEVPCDGLDNDCDPQTPDGVDNDGDGVSACGGDCNDDDSEIYPGHAEVPCNGIDDDCDPTTTDDPDPSDQDGDGYSVGCGSDCNDADADINPGAGEVECDNIDNDCDPTSHDDPDPTDADGDGYSRGCGGDCNDTNHTINPGAVEVPCDLVDNDCNPATADDSDPTDADGDGYSRGCGGDCLDSNPAVHPDASEVQCNGLDDDCNPATRDDPDPIDADNDTYTRGCGQDCDDSNFNINPGRPEITCNGWDDDCNTATADDPDPADNDNDGYTRGCGADCADNDAAVYPGHTEDCDAKDNDCDGRTDYDDFGGVCLIGQPCQTGLPDDQERCAGQLYCQNNVADGRNLCTHWCNNSHELPGDTDGTHECPAGYKCELYSNTDSAGFCWPVQPGNGGKDVGAACGADSECRSEWCLNGFCTSGCSTRLGCQHVPGWSCVVNELSAANGNMAHGLCMAAPGSGQTGQVCSAHSDCRDGFCDFYGGWYGECQNLCCKVDDCPPNYYCTLWTTPNAESAIFKACDWGTRGTGAFGSACTGNSDCASAFCLDLGDGNGARCNSLCCRDTDCPGGYKCDFAFTVDMSPYDPALGRACVPE